MNAQDLAKALKGFLANAEVGARHALGLIYKHELLPAYTVAIKAWRQQELFSAEVISKIAAKLSPATMILLGSLVVFVFVTIFLCLEGFWLLCCQKEKSGKGRRGGSGAHKKHDDLPRPDESRDKEEERETTPASSAAVFAPPAGKVLACRCCVLDLNAGEAAKGKTAEELVAIHCGGKRHKKASAEARAPDRSLVGLVDQSEWDALQRKAYPERFAAAAANASNAIAAGDAVQKAVGGGRGREVAKPAAGSAAEAAALAFRNIGGKTVAIVNSQVGIQNDIGSGAPGDGGWVSVKGSGGSAASSAAAGAGGKGASGGGSAASKVVSNLLHYEGTVNILEGLSIFNKFLTPSLEATLIDVIDKAMVEGQRGKLRSPFSYRASRTGKDAASLHYGCFVDPITGKADTTKTVETLSSPLTELARRIVQLGKAELGLPSQLTHEQINCATVYILERGMHLAPTVTDGSVFGQPVFIIALAGDELLTLGRRIEGGGAAGGSGDGDDHMAAAGSSSSSSGEFFGSHDLTLARRCMLCLRGTVARDVQHAVPTTKGRLILVVLRAAASATKDTLVAKGNIRD